MDVKKAMGICARARVLALILMVAALIGTVLVNWLLIGAAIGLYFVASLFAVFKALLGVHAQKSGTAAAAVLNKDLRG